MPVTMPSGAHFTINGVWSNGRPVVTSWHALVTAVADRPTAIADAASRLSTAWFSNIIPILADNYSYDSVSWIDLNSVTGATGVHTRTPASGTSTGTVSTPPSSGYLVTKGFVGSGRTFRSGRVFMPGLPEGAVDEDGIVSSTNRTTVTAAFTAFLAAFNASAPVAGIASCFLVVAHSPSIEVTETKTRRVPDPNGVLAASLISGFTTDALVSGVKRRVRG